MKKFLLLSSSIFLAAFVFGLGSVALVYASQKLDENLLVARTSSVQMYDGSGELMVSTSDTSVVDINNLPEHVSWAFICVEDKNFYSHKGLNYGRIAKAAYKNIQAGSTQEGASTITQQLIKNTHLSNEKTMQRKLREAALAIKLEKKYSKDEILEMYMNAIYFGNGVYGLGNAARFYYDKDVNDLSIREACSLAGIIKSPARYDPLTRTENFFGRTDFVIKTLYDQEKITLEQYDKAKSEQLVVVARHAKNEGAAYRVAALSQASKLTGKAVSELANGGYRIYTYYDSDVQQTIDQTVSEENYCINNVSGQSADSCVMMASPLGHITGLHTNNQSLLNGRRNFASAMKPLVVYAPAIQLDAVKPDTLITDEAYICGDFHPKNHDGKFHGQVTVRESLAQSYNIPAVKILEYTRLNRAVDVAKGLGLALGDENLSLALGVTEKGMSFTELVGGYCALSNGGIKTSPSFINRIENRHGKIIWEYAEPYSNVLSEATCCIVTDMLKDTVKDGTARKLGVLDFDVAAKTGTAERDGTGTNTDAVIVSYTPETVLVVWHGNADMRPEYDLPNGTSGGGIMGYMARDILNNIKKEGLCFEQYNGEEVNTQLIMLPQVITLEGKIGETGAPKLRFTARPDLVYEINRKIDDNTSLLYVVKNHNGDKEYVDTTATKDKVIEYWVSTKIEEQELKSNIVKIFCAEKINKNSSNTGKHSKGKHWYF